MTDCVDETPDCVQKSRVHKKTNPVTVKRSRTVCI